MRKLGQGEDAFAGVRCDSLSTQAAQQRDTVFTDGPVPTPSREFACRAVLVNEKTRLDLIALDLAYSF